MAFLCARATDERISRRFYHVFARRLGSLRVNGRERRRDHYQSYVEPPILHSWFNRYGAKRERTRRCSDKEQNKTRKKEHIQSDGQTTATLLQRVRGH